MKYDLTTGRAVGSAVPEHFGVGVNWLDGIKKWAMAGVSILPTLALGFTTDTYLMGDEFAPNFVELASFSRASKAWEPNWDGKSGSEVGWLKEYPVDERRVGIYGPRDEGASTNHIRNPRFEGDATAPTNISTDAGVTILGTGVANGWPYVEVSLSGFTSASSVYFELPTQVAALDTETWTLSLGAQLVSGSMDNLDINPSLRLADSGGAQLANLELTGGPADADVAGGNHVRFFASWTLSNTSAAFIQPRVILRGSGGGASATLRLFLPQLEKASTPTSPILPTAGTPAAATRAADVVSGVTTDRASRGWYDTEWDRTNGGVCGDLLEFLPGVPRVGPKGLLVEEGSTNQIRNPRFEGGTASVAPTNMFSNFGGEAALSYGTENGYPYLEVALSGNISTTREIALESSMQVVAASGQGWAFSMGARIVSGDLTNIATMAYRVKERDSGGSSVASQDLDISGSIDGLHRRFFQSRTLTGGTTAYVTEGLVLVLTGAVECTLRFYAPQLEQKAFPTSVILPEAGIPAAATRATDVPSLSADPSWWGSAEFTIYAALETAMADQASARTNVFTLDDVGFDNILNVWIDNSGGNLRARQSSNGGADPTGGVATPWGVEAGKISRVAISIAEDDMRYAASKPGASHVEDVTTLDTAFVGNVTRLLLGADNAGRHLNGFIKEFSIRPVRVSDAELEALVA